MMLSTSRRAAVRAARRTTINKLSSSSLRTAAIATSNNCNQHLIKNHEQQQRAWFSSFNEPTTLFPAISSADEIGKDIDSTSKYDDAMLRSDVRTMVCLFYIFDVDGWWCVGYDISIQVYMF